MTNQGIKEFPLYDSLLKESRENKEIKEISSSNIQKMSTIVNSLTKDKMDIIMALIYHHSLVNNNYVQGKTPYNGKIFDGTRGVKYQIKDLPVELVKILWLFIDGPNFN